MNKILTAIELFEEMIKDQRKEKENGDWSLQYTTYQDDSN